MTKRLSDLLEDLAVHARKAEDATAAAEKEGREKITARQQEAYAATKNAVEKVEQKVKSAGDLASRDLSTVKAKIAADLIALKEGVAHAGHELDVKHAQVRADRLSGRRISLLITPLRRLSKRDSPRSALSLPEQKLSSKQAGKDQPGSGKLLGN